MSNERRPLLDFRVTSPGDRDQDRLGAYPLGTDFCGISCPASRRRSPAMRFLVASSDLPSVFAMNAVLFPALRSSISWWSSAVDHICLARRMATGTRETPQGCALSMLEMKFLLEPA
jgi:hypothetical protein